MKYIILLPILALFGGSCKKTGYYPLTGGGSLTIVNAVAGTSGLVPNFNSPDSGKGPTALQWYTDGYWIGYGSSQEISSFFGMTPLALCDISDTALNLWVGILNLQKNSIYSLFVIGADTTHIDTLFTLDVPHAFDTQDSSVGVRFVNLSPGSAPVSVDIAGSVNGSEVASLPYKGITNFNDYSANYSLKSRVFEFRDQASGTLLATYSMTGLSNGAGTNTSTNTWRYHNVTIALGGTPGQQGTFLEKNY
jgi:hypothetical protein